jgi:UPF0755 protein
VIRLFFVLIVLGIVAVAAAAFYLSQPYQGFQKEVFLDFEKGTSTNSMADHLAKAGVIQNRWVFLGVRALRPHARLQAGEYQFTHSASVWTVFDRIARGDVFYYEVTVPEGSNIFDTADIIDRVGFIKGTEFLKIARTSTLIHDLAPEAPSLEGYLFPSTYRFTRRTSAQQVAKMMTDQFRRRWRELTNGQNVPVNKTVTLASLVEKETGQPEERPRVASVLLNRLRTGMALDCDPTTIYAALLDGRYRGTIYRSDLENESPYNTYRHPGLPPGPISNPGLASLKAALRPDQTDYLYFVARGDGSRGHNFSNTLTEHKRHVSEYRQTQK